MEKYRIFSDIDREYLVQLNSKIEKSDYRQFFHVQPITGLLNDPNGFCFHDGKYHMFYQWYPYHSIHGMKHWYHTISEDLISFDNQGIGLIPNSIFENYGAYSGSGMSLGNKLHVFYTGNHRDENNTRIPKQIHGILEDGIISKKAEIISTNHDYTEHQRDPSIYEIDGNYYLFLGAQRKNLSGAVLVYKFDLENHNWSFESELTVPGFEDFGYMWECPQLITIDNKDILIFSPQGVKSIDINNDNSCGYIIGKMDFDSYTFIPKTDFIQLDNGFEYYATQVAKKDSKHYLIAWMGLPDISLFTDKEKWSGTQTIVRELEVKDNILHQKPLDFTNYIYESKDFDAQEVVIKNIQPSLIKFTTRSSFELQIYRNFIVKYDGNKLFVDRANMENKLDGNQFTETDIKIETITIFIDKSSIEIFANNGEYSFTSRVFPTSNELEFIGRFDDKIKLNYSKIKKVEQGFKI